VQVAIRPARADDGEVLREVERAAGQRFREVGMGAIADDEPPSWDTLATYAAAGRSWVATVTSGTAAVDACVAADGDVSVDAVGTDAARVVAEPAAVAGGVDAAADGADAVDAGDVTADVADVRDAGDLVGYVLLDVVDGCAHVEQVSVHPDHQGAGVGRALLDQAAAWAAANDCPALTLTTFSEVPWNRPLYEHLGFRVLADDEIGPELRALVAEEAAHGLDPTRRVCMRLPVV
jgi:GNAT superfamily N-acetyltransferase